MHSVTKLVVLAALSGCAAAFAAPEGDETRAGSAAMAEGIVAAEAASEPDTWHVTDLLDPAHPPEQRERLLRHLFAEAEQGYHPAATLLGHLYFLGSDHPSGLLERRLDLAERYFRMALDAGDPDALTALAEVELARDNPDQALVWVQAHLVLKQFLATPVQRDGYAVALLARAEEPRRPAVEQDALIERVQAVMQSHGDRLAAFEASEHPTPSTGMTMTPPVLGACRDIRVEGDGIPASRTMRSKLVRRWVGGRAVYLISISPQGRIVDLVVVSSMPDAVFGTEMAASVRSNLDFNAAGDECHRRWSVLPLESGDFQSRLR